MKIFYILSSLLSVAVAQQAPVFCIYYLYGSTYSCDLTINNPDGHNNFTEVGGIHLEGYTNADVEMLFRVNGVTPNVPSIICDTFPNLSRMELVSTGLSEIDSSGLDSCTSLTALVLPGNRITSVSANAFTNLDNIDYINLERNWLTTLPETVFANQQSLTTLDLNENWFENLPAGLFRPLQNLQFLFLANANINEVNNEWFETNSRLSYLHLSGNRINLTAGGFAGLEMLPTLNLADNQITEIPLGVFSRLTNLQDLYLYRNNIQEIQADTFQNLGRLNYLDLSENPIEVIQEGAFNGLSNVTTLYLVFGRIRQLLPNSFVGLENVDRIYLNFNQLEELPAGVFAPLQRATYIGLWLNRLKTLRRNNFGTLTSLQTLDLDGNVVNALDREIIVDAVNLNTMYFSGNLCASSYFGNFLISRPQFMAILETCFANMRFIVDTTTEGDDEFTFFDGPHPGIALRVNSTSEVHISLTPFNFEWSPMIEIFIGTTNNTRSTIRINQETNVVTVPSPNILTRNQWNDFRVTWENQVILVYSANNTFPFMTYTMQDFFPVNFYGLRAVESAWWSVQPFTW